MHIIICMFCMSVDWTSNDNHSWINHSCKSVLSFQWIGQTDCKTVWTDSRLFGPRSHWIIWGGSVSKTSSETALDEVDILQTITNYAAVHVNKWFCNAFFSCFPMWTCNGCLYINIHMFLCILSAEIPSISSLLHVIQCLYLFI